MYQMLTIHLLAGLLGIVHFINLNRIENSQCKDYFVKNKEAQEKGT